MNRVIVGGRIVGTVAGVCTAGATSIVASGLNIGMVGQIAVAASICAIFAYSYPSTRVSLLTVPVVLLSAAPGVSIVIVALYRGSEVIIGSLVGGALHYAVDKAMARHFSKQRTPDIGD